MKNLKNLLMLFAVLIAVTGAFAFKKVLSPGDKHCFTTQPVSYVQLPDGHYEVTFGLPSIVTPTPTYFCDETPPIRVCCFTETGETQIIENPDGTVTYTHVLLEFGVYNP